MRWRGIDIAGALAVVGVLVLLVVTFWPASEAPDTVVTQSSEGSILGSPTPSPSPTAEASPQPSEEPEEDSSPEPKDISPERRAEIDVLVLNAGANDGAAALATGALAEQSFQPRDPEDAVAESPGIRVLHAANRRPAALTVARIVGADTNQVVRAKADDPNWSALGTDLDVLVIVGPPLP